uniref:Protein kinase domain-containing protein n=1 Tax=Macrostomum lignano TaxID=282301 RepID=A0A1I8FBD7_9PLAT
NGNKDDDVPRLNIILTEAFLSVYLATLSYGLTTANAKILHRLVARSLTTSVWGAVFGGGLKTPQRPRRCESAVASRLWAATLCPAALSSPAAALVPRRQAQQQQQQLWRARRCRRRLNRSSNQQPSPATSSSAGGGGSRGFTERFVQPRASILGCLLAKLPPDPRQPAAKRPISTPPTSPKMTMLTTTLKTTSMPRPRQTRFPASAAQWPTWTLTDPIDRAGRCARTPAVSRRRQALRNVANTPGLLMRCACVRVALDQVGRFLPQVGLELSDLPVESPALYNAVKRVHQWQRAFRDRLRRIGQPPDGLRGFNIPSLPPADGALQAAARRDARTRSPFGPSRCLNDSANRLWAQLVRKEAEAARRVSPNSPSRQPPMSTTSSQQQAAKVGASPTPSEPCALSSRRINAKINPSALGRRRCPDLSQHQNGEAISSFCLSRANQNCLTLGHHHKELVELDICDRHAAPVFSPAGLDDEDYGGLASRHSRWRRRFVGDAVAPAGFRPSCPRLFDQLRRAWRHPGATLSSSVIKAGRPGSFTRRSLPKPRQVEWRPTLTGTTTYSARPSGAIDCYEWSHRAPLTKPGSISVGGASQPPCVSTFTAIDSPFGDSEGYVSLGTGAALCGAGGGGGAESDKPYRVWRGHSRGCSDLLFAGCSTLYALAARAPNRRRTRPSGTLCPPVEKSVMCSASSIRLCRPVALRWPTRRSAKLFASRTAKGGVALLDLRKAAVRHAFQAHEPNSAVTTLCRAPPAHRLADGSVRAWRLGAHEPLAAASATSTWRRRSLLAQPLTRAYNDWNCAPETGIAICS